MKKLLFTFALLGLFALSVPKNANALHELMEYPGYYEFCGYTCLCWDSYDYVMWDDIYCPV